MRGEHPRRLLPQPGEERRPGEEEAPPQAPAPGAAGRQDRERRHRRAADDRGRRVGVRGASCGTTSGSGP